MGRGTGADMATVSLAWMWQWQVEGARACQLNSSKCAKFCQSQKRLIGNLEVLILILVSDCYLILKIFFGGSSFQQKTPQKNPPFSRQILVLKAII